MSPGWRLVRDGPGPTGFRERLYETENGFAVRLLAPLLAAPPARWSLVVLRRNEVVGGGADCLVSLEQAEAIVSAIARRDARAPHAGKRGRDAAPRMVFVSCERIDEPAAQGLLRVLREAGWVVEHSPRNPRDGDDPRWRDWYERGLLEATEKIDAFVVVLTRGWDSSTWMGVEADRGRARAPRLCVWNPDQVTVEAAGMKGYLGVLLPPSPTAAVAMLGALSAAP